VIDGDRAGGAAAGTARDPTAATASPAPDEVPAGRGDSGRGGGGAKLGQWARV
jgi:hypothetical protein